MKSRQKRRPGGASSESSSIPVAPSTSDEEGDSDAETNFSLLTGRDGGKPGNSSHTREEEFNSDEEDKGSVPAEEESDEESDADEEDVDDGDEDSDSGCESTVIQTREDVRKGAFPC